jgi:hypothetical protein
LSDPLEGLVGSKSEFSAPTMRAKIFLLLVQ